MGTGYPAPPCEEMTLDNVDAERARWVTSNHPISRHAYDLLVVVPPRRELWMLARMQGRGRGCHRLPPVDPDAGSPYVIAEGRMAAYDFDTRTWRYTEVPSVNFGTGAEYDPVSGNILLVSARSVKWLDPAMGALEQLAEITEPDIDTGRGVTLVYHAALDRFYVVMARPRRPEAGGVWEIVLERGTPPSARVRKLEVSFPDAPAPAFDAWAYSEADDLIVGGVTEGTVFAFDPRSETWYAQEARAESSDGASVGTVLAKALVYDGVDGVLLFRSRSSGQERTWAYRWAASAPVVPPPSGEDAGGPLADGGEDAGALPGDGAMPSREEDDAATASSPSAGGCGCRVGDRSEPSPFLWGWPLLLGGLLAVRARRR